MFARLGRFHVPISLALAGLVVALMLASCAPATASSNATSTPSIAPSPTASPAPRVLYEADLTHRASEWKLPPHWSIVNGALQNDGQGADVIELPIPYQITVPNYTLSMRILTLAAIGPGVNHKYAFLGKSPAGKLLYSAGLNDVERSLHSYALIYPANPDASNNKNIGYYDFTPGRQTYLYQVQVEGPFISFIAGEGRIGTVKSADQLSPAQLVFVDKSMQLVIQSVEITTP